MNPIYARIAKHKSSLEKHPFCLHLTMAREIDGNLDFIPKMSFFVLGFRDILETIRIDNPSTPLEEDLNLHCDEDSNHWLWFIEDLARLDMDINYWGGDINNVLQSLWSADTYEVRKHTYRVIHHINNTKSPEEKLIIIDCLECAFSVFISHLNQLTQRTGFYKKLRYFGEQHHEDEANHSMGSWLDDNKLTSNAGNALSRFRNKYMLEIVDDIFMGFNQVFECWLSALPMETEHKTPIAV